MQVEPEENTNDLFPGKSESEIGKKQFRFGGRKEGRP